MDKESVATYKIVKDGPWYMVFKYDEDLLTWLHQAATLTYFGARHEVKKLIKKKKQG